MTDCLHLVFVCMSVFVYVKEIDGDMRCDMRTLFLAFQHNHFIGQGRNGIG